MIFELQYCVPTELLTEDTFNLLVDKLVIEGYTLPSVYMKEFDNWQAFDYIGVNSQGDILLYSGSGWFYHSVTGCGDDSGRYPYVYSTFWLNKYLGVN